MSQPKLRRMGLFLIMVSLALTGVGAASQEPANPLATFGVRLNPVENVPHLLVGLTQPDTPLGRSIEAYRLFETLGSSSARVSPVFINGAPTFEHEVFGKKVKFIFADWAVRERDGVQYLEYLNPGLGRELWTIEELNKLDATLLQDLICAVDCPGQEGLWKRLDPPGIERRMIAQLAEALGESPAQLRKDLDQVVQLEDGYQVDVRAYMGEPRVDKADFIPDTLIVAALPKNALAVTTSGTWGAKRIVIYSPLAWQLDYIWGNDFVLQHELAHANSQFQNIPFSFYYDVELFAELASLSADVYPFELYFHPYFDSVRRAIKTFFSFDAYAAASQLFPLNIASVMQIDEEKFNEFQVKVNAITGELKRFVREVLFPTFYQNPLWWISVAIKQCEAYAPFDILMSMTYEPTLLDGAQNTALWYAKHQEQIERLAGNALKRTGEEKPSPEKIDKELVGFSSCPMAFVPMPKPAAQLLANPDFQAWLSHYEGGTK